MILIQTDRETLLKPLQAVTGIVERRHTLPILSNVLIERQDGALRFTTNDDVVFQFDYALLEQVLVNIIHNSIIYTPPGSEIKIEALSQNQSCIIIISDQGDGFTNDELNHLFIKFFRAPGSKTGGTGLGLSITKGLVEAHGGTISAMNGKNGGAVFTIILPISSENRFTSK